MCREHAGEKGRYVCKDHEKVLCPKCLIAHKVCDFESIGPSLSHDARQRWRQLLSRLNARFNKSNLITRRVKDTIEGLDNYKVKQIDDINFHFDEIIRVLNQRR